MSNLFATPAFHTLLARIDEKLRVYLPSESPPKAWLSQAMAHAVLNGGKRVRPLLVYLTGLCFEAPLEALDPAAAAIEFIHCYSLVHDDLPAMDDDNLRRGKPTCHIAYDEATAILAGDALQALAFSTLSKPNPMLSPQQQLKQCHTLSIAAGFEGMVGGQSLDLLQTNQPLGTVTIEALKTCHLQKTGALLQASILLGLQAASKVDEETYQQLSDFGLLLGLAFQVQDDILDCQEDTLQLGKTAQKDLAQKKLTYVEQLGITEARAYAKTLSEQAMAKLAILGDNAELLRQITQVLLTRRH